MLRNLGLLAGLVTALAALKAAWPFKTIEPYEAAIKTRLGRVVRTRRGKAGGWRCFWRRTEQPRVYTGRTVYVFPGWHKLRRCRTWEQATIWEEESIPLKDGYLYRVGLGLLYEIADPYRALFLIDELSPALKMTCHTEMRAILGELGHKEVADRRALAESLEAAIRPTLAGWGIENFSVRFHVFYPTGETAEVLLGEVRAQQVDELSEQKGWSRAASLAAHGASVMLVEGNGLAAQVPIPVGSGNGHGANGNGNGVHAH